MDPKNQRTYTGRSGQMAVLAELLLRGCNAAIPEIDVGEDLFAFQDGRVEVDRLQIKTARAKAFRDGTGYSAEFSVPLQQLRAPDRPPLFYVLAVRLEEKWTDFLIISRWKLWALTEDEGVGYVHEAAQEFRLRLSFRSTTVNAGAFDFTPYRNRWELLPALHLQGPPQPSPM
jgi:hypothetical protein